MNRLHQALRTSGPRSGDRLRALLQGITIVALAGLVAACGGSSDEPVLNPAIAEERLHAALLSPDDIPTGTWTVTEDDAFGDPKALALVPPCSAVSSVWSRGADESTAGAQRRLERDPVASVEVELHAFASSEAAADFLSQERGLSSMEIAACSEAVIRLQTGGDAASVALSTAGAVPPHSGIAYAHERDVEGSLQIPGRIIVHVESYIWTQGNVYVNVSITTLKRGVVTMRDEDVTDLVDTVLRMVSESVDAALERQRIPCGPLCTTRPTRPPPPAARRAFGHARPHGITWGIITSLWTRLLFST
jgi:hypothetical protein